MADTSVSTNYINKIKIGNTTYEFINSVGDPLSSVICNTGTSYDANVVQSKALSFVWYATTGALYIFAEE